MKTGLGRFQRENTFFAQKKVLPIGRNIGVMFSRMLSSLHREERANRCQQRTQSHKQLEGERTEETHKRRSVCPAAGEVVSIDNA